MMDTAAPDAPLTAFRKALEITLESVEPGSSAATRLRRMIHTTDEMLHDARSDDQSWAIVESALMRSYRAMQHG